METLSFFSTDGITSTSANHLCNLARERARKLQSDLKSVSFINESIKLIGSDESTVISAGLESEQLEKVQNAIVSLGRLNSLIAFFMEAIKEKERQTKLAKEWVDSEAREELENKKRALLQPKKFEYTNERKEMAKWSVGEQEKYLSLEAMASAIGNYIHEDGSINNARQAYYQAVNKPNKVDYDGSDTIITSYSPSVVAEKVDDLFFSLQKMHRSVQAELNGMKKKLEDAVDDYNNSVNAEYRTAYAEYNFEMSLIARATKDLEIKEAEQREKMLKEVQSLKIAIPQRLRDIYESLV